MHEALSIKGYWNKKLVLQTGIMCFLTTCLVMLLFPDKLVDFSFILGGILVVLLFFILSNFLFHRWIGVSTSAFERRLIFYALGIRIIAAIALYLFYEAQTGEPFEYNAVDSKFYHLTALRVSEQIRNMNFDFGSYLSDLSFSDQGYNLFLGTLYAIFGPSILVARIFNAILSSFTVLLIYKLARKLVDGYTARIAGIAALLLPNFLLYLGTHLKEPLMVFLLVAALYQSVQFIQFHKRDFLTAGSLLLLFFLLFMFRTVLAAVMVGSFVLYAFFSNPPNSKTLTIVGAILLLSGFCYLVMNSQIGDEITQYIEKSSMGQSENMQFRASRDGGNKLALLAGAPLFISIILIAPFPSMVFIPEQDLLWMFIGANFIRNFYTFFTILGIVYLVKRSFRKTSLLFFFMVGYFLVLANSGFAISERFHLPVVPVLIIYSAAGISYQGARYSKWYPIYLGIVLLFIIGWNYFKLAGRA